MLSVVLSLIAGLVVGIGYALCGIRSPAPPAIALLGLLGMLAGEYGTVLALRHFGVRSYEASADRTNAQPSNETTPLAPGR
jgi:XapX domain-containing protein